MNHDVFISYSRKDNENPEWLTHFKAMLVEHHLQNTPRNLNVFLDTSEIKNGDDWRKRLCQALLDSAYLLAVVSPNYFKSDACRWEFEEFSSREFERFAGIPDARPTYAAISFKQLPERSDRGRRFDSAGSHLCPA